ncbi:hypothetical protein H845_2741 [Komagataeibacter xylinus E25]|nr:hypothetical protein H845_2741 [Komagataeibacter xylinus E25]
MPQCGGGCANWLRSEGDLAIGVCISCSTGRGWCRTALSVRAETYRAARLARPERAHARRSLRVRASWICRAACRLAIGVPTFFQRLPSVRHYPAWHPPEDVSGDCFHRPAPTTVWPRTPQDHHGGSSLCRMVVVASLIPYLWQRSETVNPDSWSFRILMICSSAGHVISIINRWQPYTSPYLTTRIGFDTNLFLLNPCLYREL